MKIVYRQHAVRRMFEREISADDVLYVLRDGETIEPYPNDVPYPSRLMLGFRGQRPLHVVIADNLAEIPKSSSPFTNPIPRFGTTISQHGKVNYELPHLQARNAPSGIRQRDVRAR